MLEKPKSNTVVTSKWDNDRQALTLEVVGSGQAPIEVFAARLSQEVQDRAMVHGLTQRLSNRAALPKGSSALEKWEAIKSLADHFNAGGEWELRGGAIGPRVDEWVLRAIGAIKGITLAQAREMADQAAESKGVHVAEVVKKWGAIPVIAEKANELRAAASGVTEEEVAEMEADLGIKSE
jgi:3-deoxy-D-arabino-heptulosonate 7-phosphate (DAHP) synthase